MHKVKVLGEASKSQLYEFNFDELEKEINLMELLRSKDINIASSCYGEGVCKKCIVKVNDENLLSCQKSLANFESEDIIIEVSYL